MGGRVVTCPRCSEPARKVPWSPYVEGFDKGLDEGEWRALLERDVADVERYILDCQSFFTPTWQGSWERVHIRDCQAWLTRARTVLAQ